VLSGYIDRTLVYIPIPFLISKEPSNLICLSCDIPNIPLLPHMGSINTLVDIWFIGYVEHGRVWGPKLCIFVTQLYKPMSLVAQPLLHPSLVYTSFTNLLQWIKHKCTKNHSKQKAQIPSQQTLHSHNNSVTSEGVLFQGHTTPLYTIQKEITHGITYQIK
jgi:hypothetical protein